jgi:hypothetical protein
MGASLTYHNDLYIKNRDKDAAINAAIRSGEFVAIFFVLITLVRP